MCVYLTNVPCITIIICMYLFSRVACKCKPEILEIKLSQLSKIKGHFILECTMRVFKCLSVIYLYT